MHCLDQAGTRRACMQKALDEKATDESGPADGDTVMAEAADTVDDSDDSRRGKLCGQLL